MTLTAFLVFTVLGSTDVLAPVGFAGLPIGFVLAMIHLVSIPVTNTSVNPGAQLRPRALGRRVGALATVALHSRAAHWRRYCGIDLQFDRPRRSPFGISSKTYRLTERSLSLTSSAAPLPAPPLPNCRVPSCHNDRFRTTVWAVVFEIDGTLIRTHEARAAAWSDACS